MDDLFSPLLHMASQKLRTYRSPFLVASSCAKMLLNRWVFLMCQCVGAATTSKNAVVSGQSIFRMDCWKVESETFANEVDKVIDSIGNCEAV